MHNVFSKNATYLFMLQYHKYTEISQTMWTNNSRLFVFSNWLFNTFLKTMFLFYKVKNEK